MEPNPKPQEQNSKPEKPEIQVPDRHFHHNDPQNSDIELTFTSRPSPDLLKSENQQRKEQDEDDE